MGQCSCNQPVSNLGMPGCIPQMGIITRVAFMPVFKQDGTLNSIDTTLAIDSAYFDTLQYHIDPFQRLYPLPYDLENVELPKDETVYQTFNSGTKRKIKDGERHFTALLPEAGNVIIGKIEKMGCSSKVGVFLIDNKNQIIGIERNGNAGKLFPIPLADSTIDAMFSFANDSEVSATTLMFDFDKSVADEMLSLLENSEMNYLDIRTILKGKMDLNIVEVGTSSATGFTAKITLDYGTAKTKIPVKGLLLADFNLFNTTTSLAVVPTSVTESVDGEYTFVIPSQTLTNKIRVGLNVTTATKPFDASRFALAANFITI